jgi:hypothetical protein
MLTRGGMLDEQVCPHTPMCPHTPIYVFVCYYVCVLMLQQLIQAHSIGQHTPAYVSGCTSANKEAAASLLEKRAASLWALVHPLTYADVCCRGLLAGRYSSAPSPCGH